MMCWAIMQISLHHLRAGAPVYLSNDSGGFRPPAPAQGIQSLCKHQVRGDIFFRL